MKVIYRERYEEGSFGSSSFPPFPGPSKRRTENAGKEGGGEGWKEKGGKGTHTPTCDDLLKIKSAPTKEKRKHWLLPVGGGGGGGGVGRHSCAISSLFGLSTAMTLY